MQHDVFDRPRPLAGTAVRCRPAAATDADAAAPLIYASGTHEFSYFLGESSERCIAFLAFAFGSSYGRFSWRRHRVAVDAGGNVVGIMAAHDGRAIAFDDPHVAWMLLRFFGLTRTIGMLLRGLVLESELPAPKRRQILIAHCATHERVRGTGVFSALFDDALLQGVFAVDAKHDRSEVVLDVLDSNPRARALYERLGFVAIERSRVRSVKLPAALASTRMRFERRAGRDGRPADSPCLDSPRDA
ncbi:MAG: GNAT family N-acetyltransferase [Paraburkholderia sp.]|uniref:GNAT family N-acetyltransferase n=1 Tax=Paraburkholderia sp. TaxID=1926495 RepID=UPI00120F5FAB|nr:GNAT family N-acetyltransferase [Paraburkholderia sp.]TAM05842.1 MAG: GNAT family N-acetyltransferase [Paraburkholderia sp.]